MITINYTDRTPIYEQIINSIERLIALEILKEEEKLPSVRSLGIELSTNPNTIQKAYTILETRGIIYSVKGIGNFVAKNNLKDKKIKDILNEVEEKIKNAISFGLKEEELEDWIEKIKGELYDISK